jgi:hypothetical protein
MQQGHVIDDLFWKLRDFLAAIEQNVAGGFAYSPAFGGFFPFLYIFHKLNVHLSTTPQW